MGRPWRQVTNPPDADIKTFIAARRYESMTLHHVLQGFRTTDCAWLGPAGSAQSNARTSVSDSLKRRELLEEFLFWYFDSFLLQLLKVKPSQHAKRDRVAPGLTRSLMRQTNFYITESSAFRNQVLYFRHDDWETLCRPLIDRLTSDTFRKLEQVGLFVCELHVELRDSVTGRGSGNAASAQVGLLFCSPPPEGYRG